MYSSDVRRIAINLYKRLNSLRKVSLIIETSHISQIIIPRLENQQKTSGTALNW